MTSKDYDIPPGYELRVRRPLNGKTSSHTITRNLAPGDKMTVTVTEGAVAPSGPKPAFLPSSPYNQPIPSGSLTHANSAAWIAGIKTTAQPVLRSDPTMYAYPVYPIDPAKPAIDLICSGKASIQNLDGTRTDPTNKRIPGFRGSGLAVSPGSDSQIIMLDPSTGDEWDVWQFNGNQNCTNATLYKGALNRTGADFTVEYWSRGAGVPYLAGLIRRSEVDAGVIPHALAFAYHSCSPAHVWPATKSDGKNPAGIPQGSRLQLDPMFDVTTLTDPVTRMIAVAFQKFGAFCIDSSGSNKIVPEAEQTAHWGTLLTSKTVNAIPIDRLRVLA